MSFNAEGERPKRVLLVEPERAFWMVVDRSVRTLARVEGAADFQIGRARLMRASLFQTPFDLLVANLQLGSYNGLHLVHLMGSLGLLTRSVVYSTLVNMSWATEVQRAGAFYETRSRLPYQLPAYLLAQLPDADRRQATLTERRSGYRGGRRRSDLPTGTPPGLASI
jgi:hypothetical protein